MGRLDKINPDNWASADDDLEHDKNKSKKQKKPESKLKVKKVKDPQKEKTLGSNSSLSSDIDTKFSEMQIGAIPAYIRTALSAILPNYYQNRVQQGARGIAILIKMVADYFQISLP